MPFRCDMRAIIVGAGSAGRELAGRLYAERYDVVVIDRDPAALSALQDDLDIQTIAGHGASPAILKRAGVEGAELLVAVTDDDEVNILACICGQSGGTRHRVARIGRFDVRAGSELLPLKDLGVDLAVNPKEECAVELAYLLQLPGAEEVVDLLGGRVLAMGFRVSADSPLLRMPLRTCLPPEIAGALRFIAVRRGDDVAIPFGDATFMVGDDLYAVGPPSAMMALLGLVYPDRPEIRRVVIGGGGSLGLALARQLEITDIETVLIESDPTTADQCSAELERALVLRGDAMATDILENAGVNEKTAFVSTTGSDENNIIMCLVAQKAGASFTVGCVSKPGYVPIIQNLSLLDRAVSPHLSMMNAILHFIRGRNVQAATLFQTLPGELLEIELGGGHPWVGRLVKSLGLPKGAILATMERGGEVSVPTGDTRLAAGDRIAVFALPATVRKLGALINR